MAALANVADNSERIKRLMDEFNVSRVTVESWLKDMPLAFEMLFVLNPDSAASEAGLIIIDECSMVAEDLAHDLLSFGRPILVLGDPAQFPPIKGAGYFTDHEPDIMLTEIHRQAENDPIIWLIMLARSGRKLPYGAVGKSKVLQLRHDEMIHDDYLLETDQLLVWKNTTRQEYNRRLRQLRGFTDPLPVPGDKLVCLKNNRDRGLLNGGLWTVTKAHPREGALESAKNLPDGFMVTPASRLIDLDIISEDEPGEPMTVTIDAASLTATDPSVLDALRNRGFEEFDYGYALTVHKAQGSQWPNVLVLDEYSRFYPDRDRWLYTAITRASESVTVFCKKIR
jgi:ATP-dependent exoDNAse (exonuclease V) alpha subunit